MTRLVTFAASGTDGDSGERVDSRETIGVGVREFIEEQLSSHA